MADTGEPPLCNCGFYGNPQFDNLCSKCYKDKQKQLQQQKGEPVETTSAPIPVPVPAQSKVTATPALELTVPSPIAPATASPTTGSISASPSTTPIPGTTPSPDGAAPEKKKPRCAVCKVKITFSKLTTNKCKCGEVFCDKHRLATEHECTYDWKGLGRAKIEKDLEKVKERKSGGRSFHRLDSSS